MDNEWGKGYSFAWEGVQLPYPVLEIKCVDKKWIRIVYDDGRVVKYLYNRLVSEE